jgi:hypothetical protein
MIVGHVNYGTALGTSTANKLTVNGTGTASMTSVTVGYANVGVDAANANVVQVTNGGQLTTTSGASYIGRANVAGSIANINTATVTGTNSLWNAGNQTVYVGYTSGSGISTGNVLTVSTGGMATNINVLKVSATNTLSLGPGGQIYASTVTNSGTLSFSIDDAVTPSCGHLTVTGVLNVANATIDCFVPSNAVRGAVHILADYGTLSGSFLFTNGLWEGCRIDTNYNSSKQIAILIPPASGTVFTFF